MFYLLSEMRQYLILKNDWILSAMTSSGHVPLMTLLKKFEHTVGLWLLYFEKKHNILSVISFNSAVFTTLKAGR